MVAIVSGNSLGLSLTSLATLGQQGVLGTAGQGRNGEQSYVNVFSGNLVLQDFDDRLESRGLDVAAIRTYNSQGTFGDDNGDNWTVGPASQRVQLVSGTLGAAGSTVLRTAADGSQSLYTWNAAKGVYLSTAGSGAYDTIAVDSAAGRLVWTDGGTGLVERYESTAPGRLMSSVDPFGNSLTYAWDASNKLLSVADASGETTYFDYIGSNLSQIRTVTAGNVTQTRVRYGYDATNRLTSVTVDISPADGSIVDGKTYVTTYTYDGTSKRIASIAQSDGTSQSFTYVLVGADYKVATSTDGLGRTTSYAYDTANSRTTVTDPLGLSTLYTYDPTGQLVSIKSPVSGSASQTTTFLYTANGDVAQVIDSGGHSVDMQYDANGNQTLQRDSAGNTVTRTFDVRDQVLTETVYLTPDPDGSGSASASNGLTTRYVYNGAQLRFVVTPEGRVTEYRYDGYGQRTSASTYSGGAYPVAGLGVATALTEAQLATWVGTQDRTQSTRSDMSYDARGQLQQVTVYSAVDASGAGVLNGKQSVTQYVYDQSGLLLSTIGATGGQSQFVYDGLGRILSSKDALNQVTLTSYDDANNKTSVALASGLTTTSAYDRNGRLISVRDSAAQSANLGETKYDYDKDNRLYLITDPTGAQTLRLYDELGRLVGEVDPMGRLTEYAYNQDNLLSQKTVYANPVSQSALASAITNLATGSQATANSALGSLRPSGSAQDQKTWSIYDAAGRLVRTVRPDGAVSDVSYDGASRVIAITAYNKTISTSALGAVATLANTAPTLDAGKDRVTRNFYDADGLLRGTLDAEGYLTEFKYDAAGRLASQTSYATVTTQSLRAAGTLTDLLPSTASGDMTSRWVRDAQGRISGEIDAEGYLTERVYDNAGNVTTTIRYATRVNPGLLGTAGSTTDVASLRPASQLEDRTTATVYDALGRVSQQTNAEGAVTQYQYDAVGNVTLTVLAAGTAETRTLTARYDIQGRLVGELTAEGSALLVDGLTQAQIDAIWTQFGVSHSYDAAGRRISTTDQYGNKTLFFYDKDSRLTHSVNALGEVEETQYNTLGQVSATVTYGTRINLSGLSGGLVSTALTNAIDAVKNNALDSRTSYTYALSGKVASQTDALSNTTQYTYNAFGDLSGSDQQVDATRHLVQTFTVDRRGLVTATAADATGVNATTSTTYDAFGRVLTAQDANGNTRQMSHDRLGRVVSTVDPLNSTRKTTYDAFGRVSTQTDALGKVTTYSYSKSLRTVTITTPENISVTTVHNLHGQTQQVIDGLGQTTAYSYDLNGNLIGTATALTATSATYDRANRLVQTTDANGNIVRLTYDAANRVLTRTVDPSGLNLVTTYQYDAQGREITVTDANGTVTQFSYDLKGRMTRQAIDPSGLNLVTQYTFDARGKTLTVTSPQGSVTTYAYDILGRRISETLGSAGAVLLSKTYAYDKNGNVTSVADAASNSTRYVYDADDRLIWTVGPSGEVTRNVHDAEGRVIKVERYATAISTAGLSVPATAADIAARVVASSSDGVEDRVLDKDGRLTATVDSLGGVVTYKYDANGNVIERLAYANRIDKQSWAVGTQPTPAPDAARDQRIRTAYDALGRALFTIDGNGAVVRQAYDGNGNVVERVAYSTPVPAGTAATPAALAAAVALVANGSTDARERFAYDAAGRMTWRVDGVGAVTQFVYDADGNVTKTIAYATQIGASALASSVAAAAGDRATDYVYDAANRQTWVVNALGAATQFVYDKNGNLVARYAFANPTSVSSATSQRTAAGLQATVVRDYSGRDRVERSVYDAANRQILNVDATGAVSEIQYDALGNPVKSTSYANRINLNLLDPSGVVTQAQLTAALTADAANDRVTTRTYDASQRLVYSVDALGYVTKSTYDALGHLTRTDVYAKSIASTTPNTTAAVAGAVVLDAANDRSTSYTYDAAGNLLKVVDPLGAQESYEYNALGEKKSFINKNGNKWTYDYDAAGRLTRETAPAVELVTLTQGSGGAMGSLSAQTPTTSSVETRLAYDALGNLLSRTEAFGRPEERTTEYAYDAVGHQVKITYESVKVYNAAAESPASAATGGLSARAERDSQRIVETTYNVFGEAVRNVDRDSTNAANDAYSYRTYDAAGNLKQEVDALGYVTGYTRNVWGEVTELLRYANKTALVNEARTSLTIADVNAAVNAAGIDHASDRRILTEYDRAGRATKVTEPQFFAYDSSAGVYNQYEIASATTISTYNAFGDVVLAQRLANSSTNTWIYTAHYLNRRGEEIATVDPMGYLTEQKFNAVGELISRTEYATKIASWNPANPSATAPVPSHSPDDRRVDWAYDQGGRKVSETRFQVEISVDGGAASTRANLTTTFGYDAVGNQTRTTDATGASTYTYYDALGRVTAIVASIGGVTEAGVAPSVVTRFLRDGLGNVLVKLETQQVGIGAPASGLSINSNQADPNRDRVTYMRYDQMGNAVQSTDAGGVNHYSSYDVRGHVSKEWQAVENGSGGYNTLFRVYEYDKLGHQTAVVDPASTSVASGGTIQTVSQAAAGVNRTEMAYNGFGELVAKGTNGGWQEYYEYDNAGHLWRTNADGGVDKVVLYDLLGEQTANIQSAGEWSGLNVRTATVDQIAFATDLRRTDLVYDSLGNVTQTLNAERLVSEGGVQISRQFARSVITSSSVGHLDESSNPVWEGANSIDISWSSLSGLGSGDVKVVVEYLTQSIAINNGNNESGIVVPVLTTGSAASVSVILSSSQLYSNQTTISWTDVNGAAGGVSRVTRITIYKKDIGGSWQQVIDQTSNGYSGHSIEVAAPDNPQTYVTLEIRPSGSPGDTGWVPVGLVNFGDALRFSATGLPAGTYEYRVKSTPPGEPQHLTATGTVTLTAPPLVAISSPLAFDSTNYLYPGAFVWQSPGASVEQVFRFRPAGSTGGWDTRIVSSFYGNDGVSLDSIAGGLYEYELLWIHAGENAPYAHAVGQINIVAAQPAHYVPPVNLPPLAVGAAVGISGGTITGYDESNNPIYLTDPNGNIVGGTRFPMLFWGPSGYGMNVSFQYRLQGSNDWLTLPVVDIGLGVDESNQPTGHREVSLDGLPPGVYEYRIVESSGGINYAQATGNVTINPVAAGHYEDRQVQVQVPVTITPADPAQYIIGWTGSGPTYGPPVVTGYDGVGNPIFGQGYGREILGSDESGPIYGAVIAIPYNTYHTEYVQQSVPVQVQTGTDPVYARDESGNIVYETVYETQYQQRSVPVYTYQWVPRTEYYWESVQRTDYVGNDENGNPIYNTYWTQELRSRTVYDWLPVQTGWTTEWYPVQVPVQRPVITGYVPHYETQWQTQTVAVQVATLVTPPDPSQFIISPHSGTPVYGPPVVIGHDESNQPIYGQGYSMVNGTVVATPYTVNQTQWQTVQVWVEGVAPPPTIESTTPPYVPGYMVGAVPKQFYSSVTTAANSPSTSEPTAGGGSSQATGANGYGGMTRPAVERTYDRWGNVLSVTDPRSNQWVTTYRYNFNNQVVEQRQPDSNGNTSANSPLTQIFYDKLGRQVAVKDANGHVNRQVFDVLGRLVSEIHADGGVISHGYNIFGNQIAETDAMGKTTTFTYDNLGRLLQTRRATVNVYGATAGGAAATWVDTRAIVESNTWDSAGRKLSQTNGNGETIHYVYDLVGNVVKTIQPMGQFVSVAYDAHGNKLAELDGNGYLATWTYNHFGQLQSHVDFGGKAYSYTYDAAGQLVSSTGINRRYMYDKAGQMIVTMDDSTGQIAWYAYDLAGNRLREYVKRGNDVYQDNHIAYDALGRMRWVSDGRAIVNMEYDNVGNRTHIQTHVLTEDTTLDQNQYFKYDSMNRQIVVNAVDANGNLGTVGHAIGYDKNGNRTSDTWYGNKVTTIDGSTQFLGLDEAGNALYYNTPTAYQVSQGYTTEQYAYDDLGRLMSVVRDGVQTDRRLYDGASRVIQTGPAGNLPQGYINALNGTNWTGEALAGTGSETQVNRYNANGQILSQFVYKSDNSPKYNVNYEGAGGYDGAGNLMGYVVADSSGRVTTYSNQYERGEGYRQKRTSATSNQTNPGGTTWWYDNNGQLAYISDDTQSANNREFVNDLNGTALYVRQGDNIQRQLVVNGEVLGRYGEIRDPNNPTGPGGVMNFQTTAQFNFGYQPVSGNYPSASPGTYAVSQGDTLQAIARGAYGDESLWYLIADANGLSGNSDLKPGQVLTIPTKVSSANKSGSFTPYDPSKIVGDTTPNLPIPKAKEACGGFGQFIMIVVAVVVTIYTAGAAAGLMAPAGSVAAGATATAGSTMALGGSVLAGTATASGISAGTMMAAAAIGGAAGSIASQVVGNAIGAQDGFSWKSVALGAIGAGVSAGVGYAAPGLGVGGNEWQAVAGRVALSNAATQGVAVALGLQPKFSWKGVAAAAVGAAVGAGVSEAIGPTDSSAGLFGGLGKSGEQFARGAASSFVAGMATSALRGGRASTTQVAIDAFGNAVANSVVQATISGDAASKTAGPAGPQSKQRSEPIVLRDGSSISAEENLRRIEATRGTLYASNDIGQIVSDAGSGQRDERTLPTVTVTGSRELADRALPTITVTASRDRDELTSVESFYTFTNSGRGIENYLPDRASDQRFYNQRVANATSAASAIGYTYLRALNNAGHDLIDGAKGLYRLVTDPAVASHLVRSAANAIAHPVDTATGAYSAGAKYVTTTSGAQMAEDALRFVAGGAVGGRVGSVVGGAALDSVAATARWVGPKLADASEAYLVRTGGLATVVESGPSGARTIGSAGDLGSATAVDASYGVAFFGDSNLGYYTRDGATIGRTGKPFFMMPLEDSAIVKNASDAARYTGRAPSAESAYLNGGDIYGLSFPTEGISVTRPIAADAGGWPHFLEGGNTAVRLSDGPNSGYLVNPTREFVIPGGNQVPNGSVLFRLGSNGEWIPMKRF